MLDATEGDTYHCQGAFIRDFEDVTEELIGSFRKQKKLHNGAMFLLMHRLPK